jgi:hypothetical protein
MADADEWVNVSQPQTPQPAASDDGWVNVGQQPHLDADTAKAVYPSLGPILSAFGHGAKEGWGDTPLGLPPEAVEWASKKGIFGPEKGGYQNPFQAFNELLAQTVVGAAQIAYRTPNAVFGAYQAGVAETGAQVGAPQLGRELAAMPEAFFGSPHPTGIPKQLPDLPPEILAREPETFQGVHSTRADFTQFDPAKLNQRDPGFYGRGVYMMPRETIEKTGSYGDFWTEEGTRNVLATLETRNPFRIIYDLATDPSRQKPEGDFASLHEHGYPYDLPPHLAGEEEGLSARSQQFTDALRKAGYDSVIVQDRTPEGVVPSELVAFQPGTLKATFGGSDLLPPVITRARELGVIGPPKPDMTGAPPAARAAAEVPPPPKITGPEPGAEMPEKAGNIRLDQIGINADAKSVLLEAAKNNDDFNQARAGNVPLAQVESLSNASGVPSEVLTGNDGLGRLMHNDAVVRTWLQAFHQATDEIADQMQKVAATGDEGDIATLREMKLRFQHMQEQVSGLTAEAGRTLGVFREFYANKGKAEALGKVLEDNPGLDADSLKKLADAGRGLNDPASVARFLHDSNKPTFWDKYLYYWVNALISGPVTHAKYIGANAAFGAYEAGVVTPIAGALGAARRALGGEGGVYVGEAAARTWGLLAGTPDAIKAAWEAARNNVMTKLPNEVDGKAVNPLTQVRPSPIGGKLGVAIGIPGRSAAGIHSFFRFLGYRAEIEAQAYRQAAKEGLSPTDGEAFWQRRGALVDNPTEDMMKAGIDNGNHLTFITEQGWFGKTVSKLANARVPGESGFQPIKLILPFTHIPGQILRAGLEQTPAAFLDTKMRADLLGKNGAVAADTARARLVAGGAVSAMVANWALNDTITGYGPTDPTERAAWLRTHEPYSVRLGGWWYSYNKFGPIGDLIGLVANLIDVGPKVGEGEFADAAGHVMKATSRILEDEVGMQGLVNLIEALDDPDRKMGRFVAGQAASNLPYSSLLRQSASITDPYMREAKTFVDQLRYAVPFARQELLPKRDWLGQPMDNPGYASIIRQRAVNADPIDVAVSQLRGFRPAPPQPRINGVALPPKMYDQYQATAGGMTRAALESLVTSPGWGQMPPGIREQIIHSMVENARRTAGSMMQASHPELIMQGIKDRQDKISGVKPTKLQE